MTKAISSFSPDLEIFKDASSAFDHHLKYGSLSLKLATIATWL